MAFTCFKCHFESLPVNKEYLHTRSVANDAMIDRRYADAIRLENQAHDDLLRVRQDYFLNMYKYGDHQAWPGEKVWLPTTGVSFGHCESCGNERPCVNK